MIPKESRNAFEIILLSQRNTYRSVTEAYSSIDGTKPMSNKTFDICQESIILLLCDESWSKVIWI